MIIYRLNHPHAENNFSLKETLFYTGAVCPVGKMGPDYFFLGGNSTPGPIFFSVGKVNPSIFPEGKIHVGGSLCYNNRPIPPINDLPGVEFSLDDSFPL